MKRILLSCLFLIPLTIFIACSFGKNKNKTDEETKEPTEVTTPSASNEAADKTEEVLKTDSIKNRSDLPPLTQYILPKISDKNKGIGVVVIEMDKYKEVFEILTNPTESAKFSKEKINNYEKVFINIYHRMNEEQKATVEAPTLKETVQYIAPKKVKNSEDKTLSPPQKSTIKYHPPKIEKK